MFFPLYYTVYVIMIVILRFNGGKFMLAINGYYDGNVAVKPNQRVIITLLNDYIPVRHKRSLEEIKSYMKSDSRSVPDGVSTVLVESWKEKVQKMSKKVFDGTIVSLGTDVNYDA